MSIKPIQILIQADVEGDSEIGALAGKLDSLAQTLDGDLKAGALAAGSALRQLGDKQAAIQRFVELKQGAQDAATKLTEAQSAAQKLGREMAASEAPTRSQTGQMAKLGAAVRAAKNEVTTQSAAVIQARSALAQYGVSTSNLAQSQVAVKAAVGAAKLEVNALIPAYAQAGQQAAASAAKQKQASADVSAGVANIGDQLRKIQAIAVVAVGGGFLGGMAKDALATADSYNNLLARIKLVTGEGPLLQSSFAGVSAIALRTNSDLEQTATLFTRIAEAGKSAGLGAQAAAAQSLALTETINQSIQLSGGSADSAKAAITQLIQGLQSGVLRGEEFNSVMEQSPRLAKALADGLGRTTGELRKMAETGALTTDVVIRSLRSQSDAIKTEFASLPPTVGRAVENLRTSWMLYVGELDKGAGVSKTVAKALDSLAGNLNTVLTVAGHAAVAWGGYAVSQKLAAAGARLSAIAVGEAAVAATGQAAASGRAAVATGAHGKAAATAAVEVAGYGAATAGAGKAAAANAAQAAGSVGGYRAIGGAVLGVVSKLALWATAAYAVASVVKPAGKWIGEHIAMLAGYKTGVDGVVLSEEELAHSAKVVTDLQYQQAEAFRIAREQSFGLSKEADNLAVKFDALIKGGDSAAEAIGKIGKDFDLSTLPGIRNASGVLDKLLADGKLTAAEFQSAWATALNGKDLTVFETTARAAFAGSKREGELLAQMLDAGLRESVKRAGLDFESLKGGISRVSQSAINDTESIINGLGRLSAQGVDTGRTLTASLSKGIDTADTQQALELVKKQIESVRATLGNKAADGLLDDARRKADALKEALDNTNPAIRRVEKAFEDLGLTSGDKLKKIAADAKTSFDTISNSGTASTDRIAAAFDAYAQRALASAGAVGSMGRAVVEASLQAQGAAKGLSVGFDDAGKVIVSAIGQGKRAVEQLGQQVQQTTEDIARQAAVLDAINAKYAAPKGGSVTGSTREERLAGQAATDGTGAYMLREKQRSGTLTADDLKVAEAVLEAAKFNKQMFDENTKAYGLEGTRSIFEELNSATVILAQVKALADQAATKSSAPEASAKAGAGNHGSSGEDRAVDRVAPVQVASHTVVNITLDGGTRTINTDAAGADVLQELLRDLGRARSTAGVR